LHNDEPVLVVLVAHFEGYQEIPAQCEFRLMYKGPPPPTLREFFNFNWQRIRNAAPKYGSAGMPGALLWTIQPITEESLKISVLKFGMGLKIHFQPKDLIGLEMEKWPAVYTFDLEGGLSIAFPAVPRLPDFHLMQLVVNLAAPWNGQEFGNPWQIHLVQQPWRKSETGKIYLQYVESYPADVDAKAYNPRVPFNSAQARDFSEIKDKQEISRILKFGRDNDWPLLLSCASSLDGTNSATVTYETTLADCEDSIPCFLSKFSALLTEDGLIGLPVVARLNVTWERTWRVEDFKIHVFITELGVTTLEQDGPPCMIFYAPRATIKMRCESFDVAYRALTMFYNREPVMPEENKHHTKEWALIAAIDGGVVADQHRVQLVGKHDLEEVATWNKEIFVAGLATQPYGSGLGKFTAKFKPDMPYSATIAIERGTHEERGTAIHFEQEDRRCLLTRRIYGISGEDTFWYVMKDWAEFQPRRSKPRANPGQLFYPTEFGYLVEKYWNVLNDPAPHADQDTTPHSRSSMEHMAQALQQMNCEKWIPLPDADAPEKAQRIAQTAALSRRCPIMDAHDYWASLQAQIQEESDMIEAKAIIGVDRSSPEQISGIPAEPDSHNVGTGSEDLP
jgi:hypothetical protein